MKKIITLLMISTIFSSCATIMHGTRQSIGISSNPSNAWVWVDKNYVGNTPLIVEMSRNDAHQLRIELAGYLPYEINFSKEISGWVFGNVIFGGLIGLAIDAVSGGIYRLTPDQIHAELRSHYGVDTKNSNESYITVVLEPKSNWEKIGNLIPN